MRSFRIEEEWAQDTLSIHDETPTFRLTAKVHVVKSKYTTAELRDPNLAQQNKEAERGGGFLLCSILLFKHAPP